MKDRIKKLRDALGINQTEFGQRIGAKQTTIASYETGRREPINSVIKSICREFHVNETWLRTGEGEMFIPMSRTDEIYAFIGKNLDGSDNFKHRLMWALSRLDEDGWKVLEKLVADMSEDEK